ncbi:MAG: 2-oxo acid dehydrogenase subunit E2 [Turneriella sp.]
MARYPNMNGFYVNNAFKPSEAIHIGMAFVLREGGLIAPAIHNTIKLALPELMKILADPRTHPHRWPQGCELPTRQSRSPAPGDLGVEEIFPIITPPQVMAACFSMLSEKPWVVTARGTQHATSAADHRVRLRRDGALFYRKQRFIGTRTTSLWPRSQ